MPLLLLIFLFPSIAFAAPLSVEVTSMEDGETRARILLAATTTSINAVEATLLLPPGASVRDLATGAGLIQHWIEAPKLEGSVVRFAGIIPGGFIGAATADHGLSADAELLSFTLSGDASITLSQGALYLNDGAGTKIPLEPSVLAVRSGSHVAPADRTPPEYIDVVAVRDPHIAQGNYALIVDAYDAGSGIDYLEVYEGAETVRAEGPYVVKDRWGVSSIRVRAYDHAGNFIETMVPGRHRDLLIVGILAALMLGVLAVYLLRKRTSP